MDKQAEYHPDESFRDSVSTISKEGRRSWIYAQRPKGKFYTARSIVSIFYLILFFSLPFVRVHGDPFFLFNILERRFVFGLIFCGWICPQTIFMEMVFRRIEYWIEGDATYQKQLTAMPWNGEKLLKRGGKHVVFFLFAFLISNTFLAYIIGTDQLFSIIREPVSMHVGGFISLLVFTGIFYA